MSDSPQSKPPAAPAPAPPGPGYVVTEFGRRRVAGAPWSFRRLQWLFAWPFKFLSRRKTARGRFPKSSV